MDVCETTRAPPLAYPVRALPVPEWRPPVCREYPLVGGRAVSAYIHPPSDQTRSIGRLPYRRSGR